MDRSQYQTFMRKIKEEASHETVIPEEIIENLIHIFDQKYGYISYGKTIPKPLIQALHFYKEYNAEYFKMIFEGIENGKIIVKNYSKVAMVSTKDKKAYISYRNNDLDAFMFVHEFAHYVDINSNPKIIPSQYYFLREGFAYYLEKQFENWLGKKYQEAIDIRSNNRNYYRMIYLETIQYMLRYINLYKANGYINEKYISIEEMHNILGYSIPGKEQLNFILKYPFGRCLVDYLIENDLIRNEKEICMAYQNLDLNEMVEYFSEKVRK